MELNLKCDYCCKVRTNLYYLNCGDKVCNNCNYKIILHNYESFFENSDYNKKFDLKCMVCTNTCMSNSKKFIYDNFLEFNRLPDCDYCTYGHNKIITTYCIDCKWNMCETCYQDHRFIPVRHEIISKTSVAAENNCNKHPSESLIYFCNICSYPICNTCTKNHTDHKFSDCIDYYTKVIEQLKSVKFPYTHSLYHEIESQQNQINKELNDYLTNFIDKVQNLNSILNKSVTKLKEKISILETEIEKTFEMIKLSFSYLKNDVFFTDVGEDFYKLTKFSKLIKDYHNFKLSQNIEGVLIDDLNCLESKINNLNQKIDKMSPIYYKFVY